MSDDSGEVVPGLRPARMSADIERLIEASSLGTPEAKAARESVPPGVGRAIALAAKYLGRAEAAEQRVAELQAAVLALADEWEQVASRLNASLTAGVRDNCARTLRALVSDPTALDRGRQEAVEARDAAGGAR